MKVKEFIAGYHPKLSEYCPCVIGWNGDVYECRMSHLDTLVTLSGDKDILSRIPENVSPLFYLTMQQKSVIVDYENQIYSQELSKEQSEALEALKEAGLITRNITNIGSKVEI